MTQKAINSLALYKGGNPSSIEQLLRIQDKRVVEELKQHFKVTNLKELAIRLSIGV